MPEMRTVHNVKTGEAHHMYSVDAREAVRGHPDEWSYMPSGGKEGRIEPPHNPLQDTLSPGEVSPPRTTRKRGEEPSTADGFGRELGGPATPIFSGETRLLVPADPNAAPVETNARRGTKAEQVAESNGPGSEPGPTGPQRRTRGPSKRGWKRVSRARRRSAAPAAPESGDTGE